MRSLLADSSAESMANQDAGHLARDNPDEFNRRVKETIVKNGQYHPEDLTPDAKGGAAANETIFQYLTNKLDWFGEHLDNYNIGRMFGKFFKITI